VYRQTFTPTLTFNLIVFSSGKRRQKETQRKMMKIKADEVNFFWPSHIKNSANSIKLSIDLSGIRLEITMKTSSEKI